MLASHIKTVSPIVLSSVCILGIINMQIVAKDIHYRTNYGTRYSSPVAQTAVHNR